MNEDGAAQQTVESPSRPRLWLMVPLLMFLGLGVFLFMGIGKDPTKLPSVLIGKPVPAFTLASLADPDTTISSADLRGETWLLNVWGSWCFACRIEHDVITRIARSGQVPVYGLNWKDERSEALRWLGQFGNPYVASAFDPSGRTGIDFGVYGAPETFLIDRRGCIRYKHVGPLNDEIVDNEILPLVADLDAGDAGDAGDCS